MAIQQPPTSAVQGPGGLPESGPVAIAYTDIVRSTALTQSLGDAAARDLLRAHNEVVRRELRRHGGVELQALGDGFKLGFANACEAVTCAVAIESAIRELNSGLERPLLSVRVGVHWGEPIRERGDLFGEAVILAHRVMSRVTGGRIYATRAAREAAGELPGVRWLERGLHHVKGFEHGLQIHEAAWAPEEVMAAPALLPTTTADALDGRWRGTAFVGRERELRQLEHCFAEAAEGRPRMVLLTGEAGIGKSRLTAEFLAMVARRPVVLASGRCFADLAEPFHPFLECLRQLREALPTPPPADQAPDLAPLARLAPDLRDWLGASPAGEAPRRSEEERIRLLSALTGLLLAGAREHTLVLALDDLQWADPQSLDVLRFLARRLAPGLHASRARLLVVATCRDADLAADSPVVGCLADVERTHLLTRLTMERFGRSEVERMLRDLRGAEPGPQLTGFVAAHSEGNPYYVEEIFRDLRERSPRETSDPAWVGEVLSADWRVPRGVKTILEQRLSRLGEKCLQLLRAAALIGPQFSFEVLRDATGSKEEEIAAALDEAERAGIAYALPRVREEVYAFHHSLVGEVLLAQLPSARRRRLHLAIAESLEARHGATLEERPDEICRHWIAAGSLAPPEKLARYASAAAERSLEVHALCDADRFATAALEALERIQGAPELDRARLQRLRVVTLGRLGRIDEARALAYAAIASFRRHGRADAANETRAAIASALILHARHCDARGYLEAAIAERPRQPGASDGWLLAEYARTLDLLGHSDRMRAIAAELHALSGRLRDPELRREAILVERNWYANHTADVRRARSLTRRALGKATGRTNPYPLAALWESQALLDFSTARLEPALAALGHALELASQTGALAKIVDVRALRALCFCFRGEWQRVDDEWGEAMAVAREVPGSLRLGQLLWARTRVDLWLGRPAPPTPSLEGTYPGMKEFGTAILATLGDVASERGDPRADQWLRAAEERHPRDGVGLNWLPAAQALLAGWTNLGRAREASAWYGPLEPYRGILNLRFTAYELARAAALCGRWERSARDLAWALRVAQREGMRPHLALTLRQKAALWLARGRPGDRPRARRALESASELLHALGMHVGRGGAAAAD